MMVSVLQWLFVGLGWLSKEAISLPHARDLLPAAHVPHPGGSAARKQPRLPAVTIGC